MYPCYVWLLQVNFSQVNYNLTLADCICHLLENARVHLSGVITEANVSFLTTLCDTVSMPVAVKYLTKTGKSGQDMLNMFAKQIDVLQSCKACLEKTRFVKLISQCNKAICNKKCETCWERKQVCDECSKNGQVSYSPALRACNHCLENNI